MKYYLIAGEASGDLHASRLMSALLDRDPEAQFRFLGGDFMAAVGGKPVKHYKEMAYMGFVPVLLHLRTIFANMRLCKADIVAWKPDVLILVDYPGFNLDIARYVHSHTSTPVFYYIAPKLWAWKEYRIKNIRRDIDQLFSILPFEKEFFEGKHHYPIHYVGNPTVDEVHDFLSTPQGNEPRQDFARRNGLAPQRPVIALLAGSRRQDRLHCEHGRDGREGRHYNSRTKQRRAQTHRPPCECHCGGHKKTGGDRRQRMAQILRRLRSGGRDSLNNMSGDGSERNDGHTGETSSQS